MKRIIKIPFVKKQKIGFFDFGNSKGIDGIFLLPVFIVAAYGTVMVFSAGTAYATARYGDTLYFIKKQTVWLLLGIAVMYLASHIKCDIY